MQDLKLNGIYIAIGHSTRHNIVKFQVLEITKTSYYILWLDVNQKGRYDKEQFAFDYRIVETIEEPELTTNYLAKNFLGITAKELKNNEKLRQVETQETAVLLGPSTLLERYNNGEFLSNPQTLYNIVFISRDDTSENYTYHLKSSHNFLTINKEFQTWRANNEHRKIYKEDLDNFRLGDLQIDNAEILEFQYCPVNFGIYHAIVFKNQILI